MKSTLKSLLMLVVLVAAAVAATAADVSGTWNVDGSVYGNAVKYTLTLKQEGEKLTGTATLEGKDLPVTGTIKDKSVTWTFTVEYSGSQYANEFTGTLMSEKDMNGTIAVGGVSGDFTAKKQ